jgi:hypothetical protein
VVDIELEFGIIGVHKRKGIARTKESKREDLAREAGAWLKPWLERTSLKFPSELPGGTPSKGQ